MRLSTRFSFMPNVTTRGWRSSRSISRNSKSRTRFKLVNAFVKQYHVPYTYLIAGAPADIWDKVPQAVNLNTWPASSTLQDALWFPSGSSLIQVACADILLLLYFAITYDATA